MRGAVATEPAIRFARHFRKLESGCWEWTGGLFKDSGYGKFNAGRLPEDKQITAYAHRFSYELHVGKIPDGVQVLHECDNRVCVNPAHLFLGSQLDNVQDMHAKGRARPRGKAPLNSHDIAEIEASEPNSHGETKRLSEKFGVSTSHIRRIRAKGRMVT